MEEVDLEPSVGRRVGACPLGKGFSSRACAGQSSRQSRAAEGSWRPMPLVALGGRGDGRETLRIVDGLECHTRSWGFIP